ncbi:unnamed protein product [Haemonchus placei]|uniref:COesterase domain-containing protein n=1 Tax=Haemonchus placei TaxID=6290 RepID=A0A0N4WF85_HAEPC|nr:unnamed protein product [Haemonchus placei]
MLRIEAGSFNAIPHGVSDVINVVKFLRDNADALHIGKITVWAESGLNKFSDVERAILINGNARTRTIGREGFSKRAAHKILTELQCDLPSVNQAMDCLRSKQLSELYTAADHLSKSFYPFGVPFRCPSYEQPAIPTILGVFRQLPKDYPSDSDFDEKFQYINFKRFLAGLIPDSQFQNAPLLRRQILHQYIYTQGDKKNTYFLFEQMRKILLDRDFIAPTQQLVSELKQKKSDVYLLEYGIDNPPTSCLQDGGWDDIKPFCDKMFQYFTRQPTKNSCEPTNPTWPAMGSTKRDYHVILKLLALDKLELKGRRDAIFKEETQLDPHEVEDDVQEWHRKAADIGGFDFTEEHALGDMPLHMEL